MLAWLMERSKDDPMLDMESLFRMLDENDCEDHFTRPPALLRWIEQQCEKAGLGKLTFSPLLHRARGGAGQED